MANQKTVLITGASSGIGHALAVEYAGPGITLLLTGRNRARLEETAALCRAKGAVAEIAVVDVTDKDALKRRLLAWDDVHPIDVLVANAGISGNDNFYEIIDINLIGTFHTVLPLLPRFKARRAGTIALMSSMAGFRGMPSAPAYSTSKVAVRAYGDALRPALKPYGVSVSIIFPGFVKTPLTDVNKFPMPFLMDVERAGRIIKRGLDKKKASIAFPLRMHIICWLLGAMPRAWSDWILGKAPVKD